MEELVLATRNAKGIRRFWESNDEGELLKQIPADTVQCELYAWGCPPWSECCLGEDWEDHKLLRPDGLSEEEYKTAQLGWLLSASKKAIGF